MNDLFNAAESRRLKEEGITKASSFPFDQPVSRARNIAIYLAKKNGVVTADDVHHYLSERLPDVLKELSPKAWGAVFRSPKLKATGEFKESKRVPRHSGVQRIWKYNPDSA